MLNIDTRSSFVALLGRPNVGKSSLLNALVGEKLAIVTPKPQTTRTRITGICTLRNTQLIFTDTPGVHKPKTKLGDKMLGTVRQSVKDMDIAVLVIEPLERLNTAEQQLIADLRGKSAVAVINKIDTVQDKANILPVINMLKIEPLERLNTAEQQLIADLRGKSAVAVINKIDTVQDKANILPVINMLNNCGVFSEIIPLSAKTDEGVDRLTDTLIAMSPQGPYFFPEDTLTEQPEKVICAELVREKLLICLDDEIPHGIAVIVERMKESDSKPIMDIDVTIYCERDSHKGIVIGKGGAMLKKVATMAREDMESFLQIKINLSCRVKVSHSWRNEEKLVRRLVAD